MKKALIILPTYNERETLPILLGKIAGEEVFDVLIIDDNSADGTADVAKAWMNKDSRINLIQRPGKLGLGTAYIAGFKWGLEKDYDCFIEMDSDLSHNSLDLPRFLAEMEKGMDLVIGSRYLNGKINVVGWDFKRLLLSKFGNLYASKILGSNISDMTSGYRAYSRTAVECLDLDKVKSSGYAFQIEMAYLVSRAGLNVTEIPIIFHERLSGSSKMSKKIVREAIWLPWRLRIREFFKPKRNRSNEKSSDYPRNRRI